MPGMPDPLRDLGSRVAAAAARAEWRADEEHWAGAALEQWEHSRTLLDRARDHLHRGDTIALHWPGASAELSGRVVAVGEDVLRLATFAGHVDVSVIAGAAIGWRVVERASEGGSSATALTFRARLLELEASGGPVEVATSADGPVRGHLRVGRDHVQVTAPDGPWVLALGAVRWVRAASPA